MNRGHALQNVDGVGWVVKRGGGEDIRLFAINCSSSNNNTVYYISFVISKLFLNCLYFTVYFIFNVYILY